MIENASGHNSQQNMFEACFHENEKIPFHTFHLFLRVELFEVCFLENDALNERILFHNSFHLFLRVELLELVQY